MNVPSLLYILLSFLLIQSCDPVTPVMVSNEVMDRFEELDSSMNRTVNEIEANNQKIIDQIRDQTENRNVKNDAKNILKDAQHVKNQAQELEQYMEEVRNDFINRNVTTDSLKKVRAMETLKQKLDNYTQELDSITNKCNCENLSPDP